MGKKRKRKRAEMCRHSLFASWLSWAEHVSTVMMRCLALGPETEPGDCRLTPLELLPIMKPIPLSYISQAFDHSITKLTNTLPPLKRRDSAQGCRSVVDCLLCMHESLYLISKTKKVRDYIVGSRLDNRARWIKFKQLVRKAASSWQCAVIPSHY